MNSARDVYTRLLFPLGYGHPLWIPEPGSEGEILIGDVGFINSGRFFRMFNIFYSEMDSSNAAGVPRDFQPLNLPPNQVLAEELRDLERPIRSTNLRLVEESAGNTLELECIEDQAAFLLLKDSPTKEQLLLPKEVIKKYMLPNCEEWAAFARSGLKPEDIRLVSGWVKTDQWFLGAITQNDPSARLKLDASFTPDTILEFIPRSIDIAYGYRVGPSRSDPYRDADFPRDQCIFVHYYKLKYRWFFIKDLEGAAEPKNLQEWHDNDDSGRVSAQDPESVDTHTALKPWDPVDSVLDYILLHSEARVAFAGTEDIVDIFGSDIPDDIPAYLERTRPHIEVGEDGVGSLLFETLVRHQSVKAAESSDHTLTDGSSIRIVETNAAGSTNPSVPLDGARDATKVKHVLQRCAAPCSQSGAHGEWTHSPDGFVRPLEVEAARAIPCV